MITSDIQKLEVGQKIDLFELNLIDLGHEVLRFHPYDQLGPIWWRGEEYTSWAIKAEGFELKGEGAQPEPTLTVSNSGTVDGQEVHGFISALCIHFDDLVGGMVKHWSTLGEYLDEKNFPEGNPSANPDDHFPVAEYVVECKTAENYQEVSFQLATLLDLNEKKFPARQIVPRHCSWLLVDSKHGGGYRGSSCGYTGNKLFDRQGNPVTDPAQDKCGGRLSDCKKRFGEHAELPYGSQPTADIVRWY